MKTAIVLVVCLATAFAWPMVKELKPSHRQKRSTCDATQCSYSGYCLNSGSYYGFGNMCVKCDPNMPDGVEKICRDSGYCWHTGVSINSGTCYICSSDQVLTKKCHVCGTDTCLPKNGSTLTVGDMTYTCGVAAQQEAEATTTTEAAACTCLLSVNEVEHEIVEGTNQVINCNEWKCSRNSEGVCAASAAVGKCKKADGSCVAVGDSDACNRECQAGQYGAGSWTYTKCMFSDGTCVAVGESMHCYTCGEDKIFTQTGCKGSNGNCFAVGENDGCNECGSGFHWTYSCSHAGTCVAVNASIEDNCRTLTCHLQTDGQTTSYGLDQTATKCRAADDSCINAGELSGCSVCKSDGTFDIKCQDSNGDCYEPNETMTVGCITYKCTVDGQSFSIAPETKKCAKTVNGVEQCFEAGSTYESNCKTYQCVVNATHVGYQQDTTVPTKCYFNNGCLAVGETDNCHTCKADGSMEWMCKDNDGNCHADGDTWGNCTCTVEDNTVRTTCS